MLASFQNISVQYDAINDKRERLVKKSRDVTSGSKKFIFFLHRVWEKPIDQIKIEGQDALNKIRKDVLSIFSEFDTEYDSASITKYDSSISPGLQEYIEAMTFYHYLEYGDLISKAKLESDLNEFWIQSEGKMPNNSNNQEQTIQIKQHIPVQITWSDYLLGIADLTGELMRYNVNAATKHRIDVCKRIRLFLHELSSLFPSISHCQIPGLGQKLDVMKQSVSKVDNVCFSIAVRSSEFPDMTDNMDFMPTSVQDTVNDM